MRIADGPGLKRSISLTDVVMLGAGSAIGSSIFTVLGPASQIAGAGLLVSLLLAAIPMGVFALIYAFMASASPVTAASYEWQRQFTHPAFAFGVVWLRVLSNAVVMVLLARVLLEYAGAYLALPEKPALLAVLLFIFAINYFGVHVAARAQTVMMLALLVVFGVFVASGVPSLKPELVGQALGHGWGPILVAIPLMIQLFLSIETATELGGEVKDAERNIPLGLGIALVLTAVIYGLVAFTTLSLLGPAKLSGSTTPLLDAAAISLGTWGTPLVVGAAVLALLKSMNAVFLVYSRFLYAMATAGVLPAALGTVHPRFGTPRGAMIAALLASGLCILLPSSLLFLLLAISFPTMAKYLGSCVAAFNVARRHPDVFARSRLGLGHGLIEAMAVIGSVLAVVIAFVGVATDWRPYVLLGAWLAGGFVYYALNGRRRALGV
jgi:APA family basic amino acid/polyamine antiporter